MHKKAILLSLLVLGVLFLARPASAQLDQVFTRIFNDILDTKFRLSGSLGLHGTHFQEAAQNASAQLSPALNSLIASNISSFPLSATVAGATFDFSSGKPVMIKESLGPIFAENARTLGQGKFNVGFNYTYLGLEKFRGLRTKDIRFTFTHIDFPKTGVLGDNPNESDLVNLNLDLNVNANLFVLLATYGITNNLDIGFAIPLANISLRGNSKATVESFTFARDDTARHQFGNDPIRPELTTFSNYNESATGLSDIALRLKYSFLRSAEIDLAALLDLRLPTGDKKDFLGTGKMNARFSWIMSKKIGDFLPHLNLGYERRGADRDSDEFELIAGFDQKIVSGVTFAAEFLGEFDVNRDEKIELLPGETAIIVRPRNAAIPPLVRQIDLSNVPERDRDNAMSAALGFRVAPSERLLLLGNVLVPLNDGGLRSNVAPTLGVTISF
ncbi:transporter [candidate division KSB1 bacterium]|nr:transporter [candidate division KSB1 bacterium]